MTMFRLHCTRLTLVSPLPPEVCFARLQEAVASDWWDWLSAIWRRWPLWGKVTPSTLSAWVLNGYGSAYCQRLVAKLEPHEDGTRLSCTIAPTAWVWLPMSAILLGTFAFGLVMCAVWVADVARGESVWERWWALPLPVVATAAHWIGQCKRREEACYLEQVLMAWLGARREGAEPIAPITLRE